MLPSRSRIFAEAINTKITLIPRTPTWFPRIPILIPCIPVIPLIPFPRFPIPAFTGSANGET